MMISVVSGPSGESYMNTNKSWRMEGLYSPASPKATLMPMSDASGITDVDFEVEAKGVKQNIFSK